MYNATLFVNAGLGFDDLPDLGCRFGGVVEEGGSDRFDSNTTQPRHDSSMEVTAIYVSPTEVVCMAPAWSPESFFEAEQRSETVRVAVTLNGQNYGLEMAQYTYYPTPQV